MGVSSPVRHLLIVIAVLALSAFAPGADAAETAKLHVAFTPKRLGQSTTIVFDFKIGSTTSSVPSPLTNFSLSLPTGMGLGTTTLGEVTCTHAPLEENGRAGCSGNSLMGLGTAVVGVPFGPEVVLQNVEVAVLMAPPIEHHTTLLFDAVATSPISGEILFEGELLPDSGQFGARLNTAIPLTPTVPGAADAAVFSLQSTIGPRGVTYHRVVNGKRVAYQPIGMTVPAICPHNGWPFVAVFSFQDGTTVSATSRIACPRSASDHKPRKH
jgi:hypothetical protein